MKNKSIDLRKFNRKVKPFICNCGKHKGASVIYYKDAIDYLIDIQSKIADVLDVKLEKPDINE